MMKVSLVGQLDGYTSHALHMMQLARRLPKFGVDVVIRPTKYFKAQVPSDIDALVQHGPNDCDIELIIGQPRICPTEGKRSIYLAAWESTRLPKQCVDILNKCERVITPSTFCATVFSACGVNVPIDVVPLGVSEAFTYQPMPDGPLTFACSGNLKNGRQRKGVDKAIELFRKAFTERDDVRLLVKVGPSDYVDDCGDSRIEVTNKWMDERELVKWMARAHCFIHFGVGAFELQVLEFMAIGRPVIATRFGGHLDYFVGLGIDPLLVPASDTWKNCGLTAEPNELTAIAKMRAMEIYDVGIIPIDVSGINWDHSAFFVAEIVRQGHRKVLEEKPHGLMVCASNFKNPHSVVNAVETAWMHGVRKIALFLNGSAIECEPSVSAVRGRSWDIFDVRHDHPQSAFIPTGRSFCNWVSRGDDFDLFEAELK